MDMFSAKVSSFTTSLANQLKFKFSKMIATYFTFNNYWELKKESLGLLLTLFDFWGVNQNKNSQDCIQFGGISTVHLSGGLHISAYTPC